jgi:fatty-acyl-CoA synthase
MNDMRTPRQHTISDLLRRTAAKHPAKLAITCGETVWTYAEFDEISSRLAAGLSHRGVGKGSRVAVLSRNSHGFAAMRFALARLGAVLVPVNFMLRVDEIAFILRHAQVFMLASDVEHSESARAAAAGVGIRHLVGLPGEQNRAPAASDMICFEELLAAGPESPPVSLEASDIAQIVYTSGTESSPKGVMLTHDAVLWQYSSCIVEAEISQSDTLLHALPLYHCAQLDVFFGPAVYVGAGNVITASPAPDNVLRLIRQHQVTSFFAPPTVWISLLRSPHFESTDLSSLSKGYYGASIMPVAVIKEIRQRLPRVDLWNLYGQTEMAPLATILKPADQLRKAGSCGRPALNVETRVVDDCMRDVQPGVVGEIVHRSPHLMIGYLDDPDRTRAAFEGGWFHSGDLASVDEEGYITVVDRIKDMIKTGGENVASRDVEEALYRLPQVAEVAVIGVPHWRWVEAVFAVIVVKAGQALSAEEVRAHCSTALASFKVPKGVAFVDVLPKNPSGKVLKRDLRAVHAAFFDAS